MKHHIHSYPANSSKGLLSKQLSLVFLLLFLPFMAISQLPGYSFKTKITIDNSKVSGTADHSNFPVLISHTDADLKTTSNGGEVTNTNGYDIVFTAADGITLLDFDLEKHVEATGEYVAWVRIPLLDYNDDTEIYMYYGNVENIALILLLTPWLPHVWILEILFCLVSLRKNNADCSFCKIQQLGLSCAFPAWFSRDHMTPILKDLHWLPIEQRI